MYITHPILMPKEVKMNLQGTTIVAVRKGSKVAIAGDGQVTQGQSVVLKGNARKVRRIYNNKIVIGFAGATADAFTLYELLEKKLNEYNGDLVRASVELAKQWRMDKQLRNLEAMLLATDGEKMLMLDGVGDVIEPENDVLAIGSGGNYARSAATAYLDSGVDFSAEEIARRAITIAGDICIFTNHNIIVEVCEKGKENGKN